MAVFSPVVTNYPNGTVSVISIDGINYSTLMQSISTTENYMIENVYVRCRTYAQLLQEVTFNRRDADGRINSDIKVPPVDPFIAQPSLNISFEKGKYILDGKTEVLLNVLPFEDIFLYFYTQSIDVGSLLNTESFDVDFLKTYNFFQDYNSQISLNKGNDGTLKVIDKTAKNSEF